MQNERGRYYMERLTQEDIEAIRKRRITSLGGTWNAELIATRGDVVTLLAEVERLQTQLLVVEKESFQTGYRIAKRDVRLAEAKRNGE